MAIEMLHSIFEVGISCQWRFSGHGPLTSHSSLQRQPPSILTERKTISKSNYNMFWIFLAWLVQLPGDIITLNFICWCNSVPIPYSQAVSQCIFKFTRDIIPPLIRLLNKHLKKQPQDGTTQTAGCGNCARLWDQVAELQGRQNKNDFDACMRSVMHEQKVELERDLDAANTELARRGHFLRVAEDQANQQRAAILSLRDELRLARADNSADSRKSLAIKQDLDRLRQKNARLTTANLQLMERTMCQKKRALMAERELDIWGDKIKTLVHDRNKLREDIDKMHVQNVHQGRRADEQREGRIRAEVEVEELRRPRTAVRREREAMFT
ncbi:hypothetical protein F4803DRAFT_576510 [Xylaria telfairii]|nr:hypothetical protein F4803DRAFT_576510 [Xylaria telfairii]